MIRARFYIQRLEGELESLQYLKRRITLSWFVNRRLYVLTYDVVNPGQFLQGAIEALQLQDKVRVTDIRDVVI